MTTKKQKIYCIAVDVIGAGGTAAFTVEAVSPEEALKAFYNGEGDLDEDSVSVDFEYDSEGAKVVDND